MGTESCLVKTLTDGFLADLRSAADDARASGKLPAFLGALETVRAEVYLGAGSSGSSGSPATGADTSDRLLTAEELAVRLKISVWSVYRNVRRPDAYPFKKNLPGGRYRFSEKGLEKWLARGGS
jgi:predicted DNA-binding transcriptional regulator AlpA